MRKYTNESDTSSITYAMFLFKINVILNKIEGNVVKILLIDFCFPQTLIEDKFVVTADRDEKIRISCYPNSYNIHQFCLGHTE